jgi:hypothetical protein
LQRFEESQGGGIGRLYKSALKPFPDIIERVLARAPVPRRGWTLAVLLAVGGANLTVAKRDRKRLYELIEVGGLRREHTVSCVFRSHLIADSDCI